MAKTVLVTGGIDSFGHVSLECARATCEGLQAAALEGASSCGCGQQHSWEIGRLQ
jgi:hypothetical protein